MREEQGLAARTPPVGCHGRRSPRAARSLRCPLDRADSFSYNAAISACGKGQAWQVALVLFGQMPQQDTISPLRVNWGSCAVDGFSVWPGLLGATSIWEYLGRTGGNWQLALGLLEQMEVDLGIRSLNGQNACIGACHVGNQWQLALQLFTDLLADRPVAVGTRGLQPDVEDTGEERRIGLQRGNVRLLAAKALAAQALEAQTSAHLRCSTVSFSSAMAAAELTGRWELGLDLVELMRGQGGANAHWQARIPAEAA
eukprot:Skav203744  [mRNA]  locus=scaffold68:490212:495642:+ [translate_table: standard]